MIGRIELDDQIQLPKQDLNPKSKELFSTYTDLSKKIEAEPSAIDLKKAFDQLVNKSQSGALTVEEALDFQEKLFKVKKTHKDNPDQRAHSCILGRFAILMFEN